MTTTTESDTTTSFGVMKQIGAGVLNVDTGPPDGPAVVLLHGWPYDFHSFVDVAPLLAAAGYRAVVPHLRGHGTTRFLSDDAPRNAEQSAIALDVVALMDALGTEKAILAGYDWGARTVRAGLQANRRELARLIWGFNSLTWDFDDATFDRTGASFDNPDYVRIVIHNYRWRLSLAECDPRNETLEKRLAEGPVIPVPAITLDGGSDGVAPATDGTPYAAKFSGRHTHRVIPGVGHNLPQEAPQAFADAVVEVDGY